LESNRRTNLTGAKSAPALAEHIIDSLTLLPYIADPLVDVGSGAGFPAIPLAIVAGVGITMIEATTKKARFLESALRALELPGTVVNARAEIAGRREELRERFALGTARAVAAATTTAELLLPFIRLGGLAVLQRGRLEAAEAAALADAVLMLGAELEEVKPAGERRVLAILRKRQPTPARFPRRQGVPEKRPLCAPR
jgi:16S rRNA (guanine527-N7)-methyltransferase